MPVISDPLTINTGSELKCLVSDAEGRIALRLMLSQLERETCIFSSLRTAIFQKVQSLQYTRKDVMVISVPYECPT